MFVILEFVLQQLWVVFEWFHWIWSLVSICSPETKVEVVTLIMLKIYHRHMVTEQDEGWAAEEVIKFGYSLFYSNCFTLSDRPVLLCQAKSMGSNCYDIFMPIFSFLHENCSAYNVAGTNGE